MAANGKQTPIADQIRAVVLALTLAATEAQREKPKEKTAASEAEDKEIAELQALLKTDTHLSKLCADGFGIPGVKLISHIVGKPYLMRAFPEMQTRKPLPPLVALKSKDGRLHLTTTPYDGNQTYTMVFRDGLPGGIDAQTPRHGDMTPATDDEIKTMIGQIPEQRLAELLGHAGAIGQVLRPAVFGEPKAAAAK